METNEKNKGLDMVEIEAGDLACAVSHLATMLNGVWLDCFSLSTNGVLNGGNREAVSYQKAAENSREWITEHYEAASGAIGVAGSIAEMLSTVCTNYHITIAK